MSIDRAVEIYGQTYWIKGEDPRRIETVAAYLDQKMVQVLGGPAQGLSTKEAVLVALNVADDWFSTKEELERIVKDLGKRVDELIGLLPE